MIAALARAALGAARRLRRAQGLDSLQCAFERGADEVLTPRHLTFRMAAAGTSPVTSVKAPLAVLAPIACLMVKELSIAGRARLVIDRRTGGPALKPLPSGPARPSQRRSIAGLMIVLRSSPNPEGLQRIQDRFAQHLSTQVRRRPDLRV